MASASASSPHSSSFSSAATQPKPEAQNKLKKYALIFGPSDASNPSDENWCFHVADDDAKAPEGCTKYPLGELPESDLLDDMIKNHSKVPVGVKMDRDEMSNIGTAMTCIAMFPQGLFAALMADSMLKQGTENPWIRGLIGFLVFLTGVWGKQRIVNFFNDKGFKEFCANIKKLLDDLFHPSQWTLRGMLWRTAVTAETLVFSLMFAGLTMISMDKKDGIAKLLIEGFSAEGIAALVADWRFQLLFVLCSLICNALGTRNIMYYGKLALLNLFNCFGKDAPDDADKYFYMWAKYKLDSIVRERGEQWGSAYTNFLIQIIKTEQLRFDPLHMQLRLPPSVYPDSYDILKIRRLFDRLNQKGGEKACYDAIVRVDRDVARSRTNLITRWLIGGTVAAGFINFFYFGFTAVYNFWSKLDFGSVAENYLLGLANYSNMILMGLSSTVDLSRLISDYLTVSHADAKYVSGASTLTNEESRNAKWLTFIVCAIGAFANAQQQYIFNPRADMIILAFLAPLLQEIFAFYSISNGKYNLKKEPHLQLHAQNSQSLTWAAEGAGNTVTHDSKLTKIAVDEAKESTPATPLIEKSGSSILDKPLGAFFCCGSKEEKVSDEKYDIKKEERISLVDEKARCQAATDSERVEAENPPVVQLQRQPRTESFWSSLCFWRRKDENVAAAEPIVSASEYKALA